jgi:uncharacterized DUF497 family protein
VRITCNRAKREQALLERGLDMLRAKEIFAGPHFTRLDARRDYGEPRFITVGWLDERLVVFCLDSPRSCKARLSHEALP